MAGRFIKLYEQITNWGWYLDVNTFKLFIHLLLKANYTDGVFQGIKVERGQLVTSLAHLSKETGLTIQQVRTALDHMISTGEITTLSYARFRIITVVKYESFQTATRLLTGTQQEVNKESNTKSTSCQQQYKNNIEEEYIEKEKERESDTQPKQKKFTPPTKEEILDYCLEEGHGIDVDRFYDYYSSKGWKVGNVSMKDWKAAVRNWARRDKEQSKAQQQAPARKVTAQEYTQRNYDNEQEEALKRMLRSAGF